MLTIAYTATTTGTFEPSGRAALVAVEDTLDTRAR
jgi:hypothetical protein